MLDKTNHAGGGKIARMLARATLSVVCYAAQNRIPWRLLNIIKPGKAAKALLYPNYLLHFL